jgi:hypothetical protein
LLTFFGDLLVSLTCLFNNFLHEERVVIFTVGSLGNTDVYKQIEDDVLLLEADASWIFRQLGVVKLEIELVLVLTYNLDQLLQSAGDVVRVREL